MKQLIWGLWYDPETKIGYSFNMKESYTFEPIPVVLGEGLRPFQYATQETALKMVAFIKAILPEEVSVELIERASQSTLAQYEISIADGAVRFGAGAIAQSLLRMNDQLYAGFLRNYIVKRLMDR